MILTSRWNGMTGAMTKHLVELQERLTPEIHAMLYLKASVPILEMGEVSRNDRWLMENVPGPMPRVVFWKRYYGLVCKLLGEVEIESEGE